MAALDRSEAERDYVEYELDVENGVITGCRFFGEGKQTEPPDDIMIYKPVGQEPNIYFDRWLEGATKRLKLAFGRLTKTD